MATARKPTQIVIQPTQLNKPTLLRSTTPLIRLICSSVLILFEPLLTIVAAEGPRRVQKPDSFELERLVGMPIEVSVRVLWKSAEPPASNLWIYTVDPPQCDKDLIRRVADKLQVTGELAPIPMDTGGGGDVGFWIKEPTLTNTIKYRCITFSALSGAYAYHSGDDGFRWDYKNHRPLMRGVPSKEEAKLQAIALLPLLGMSTNDLEHYGNGRLRWASSAPDVGYTDKLDKQRKKAVMAQRVVFYQRIPGGGLNTGIGNGGTVQFTFVSEGKVASIEWFFRKLVKAGQAVPKNSKEVISEVRRRNAWTWYENVPSTITVTNCVLAYPQGNSWLYQKVVWPFYLLSGTGADGRSITLYVQLDKPESTPRPSY